MMRLQPGDRPMRILSRGQDGAGDNLCVDTI